MKIALPLTTCRTLPAGFRRLVAAGVCCGCVALPNLASLSAQDIAGDQPEQIEDRLSPGNELGPGNEPSTDLGTPFYRDERGRFFSLDPQGVRVYVGGARWERRQPLAGRLGDRLLGRSRAKLGVVIREADQGVRVAQVRDASVAAAAGLQPGDVIRSVNGETIEGPEQLQELVQSIEPGQTAEMSILRDGETQQVEAQFPEETDGRRYDAAKPAVDSSTLQQDIQQLQQDVQDLRQQMQSMQEQMEGDASAADEASAQKTKSNEAADARDSDSEAAAAADRVSPAEAPGADTDQPVRVKTNEKAELAEGQAADQQAAGNANNAAADSKGAAADSNDAAADEAGE